MTQDTQSKSKDYLRGYQWAVDEMTAGKSAARVREDMASGSFLDPTDFDRGAKHALDTVKRCGLCDKPMPADWPHRSCESCIESGKFL